MSVEPFSIEHAVAEVVDALAPLSSLAESMGSLENSFSLQTDLLIIEKWYSEEDRKKIVKQIDAAWCAELEAHETMGLILARSDDQRTFEQYAQEHGEIVAKKAFTSGMAAAALYQAALKGTASIMSAHPVIYRVHAYVNGK